MNCYALLRRIAFDVDALAHGDPHDVDAMARELHSCYFGGETDATGFELSYCALVARGLQQTTSRDPHVRLSAIIDAFLQARVDPADGGRA